MGLQDSVFGGIKNAIEAAQNNKWQDNLAILRLLEVTAKGFGNLPNKIR